MRKRKKKEKKKFISFFLKRFLLCLIALGSLGVYQAYQAWIEEKESAREIAKFHQDIADIESRLEKADDNDDSLEFALAALSQKPTSYSERVVMLYNPETGQYYLSEPRGITIIYKNGEKQLLYLTDQEIIEKLFESTSYYWDEGIPIVKSIFIKNDSFLPGETYFVKRKNPYILYRYWNKHHHIEGKWIDLSPEKTDEWITVNSPLSSEDDYIDEEKLVNQAKELSLKDDSYHWSGQTYIVGSPDSPHANKLMQYIDEHYSDSYREEIDHLNELKEKLETEQPTFDDMNEFLADNIEDYHEGVSNQIELSNNRIQNLPERLYYDVFGYNWDEQFYHTSKTIKIQFRNESWNLFCYDCVDYKKLFNYHLESNSAPYFVWSIMAIILSLFIALLWSVISYLIYRRKYDMEAYRRNLTGALAHDLKSPLMAISGYSENLINNVQPDKKDHYYQAIYDNTQYMDRIIVNVLELSKLENGSKAKCENVSLTELISELISDMKDQVEQHDLKVTVTGSCIVKADQQMMTQALRNLLDNAIKYTPDDGCITVTGEKHTLSISNDISEDHIDKPKRFLKAFVKEDTARGNRKGTGLGLSIVQQIASQNRLKLRIISKDHHFIVRLHQNTIVSKLGR